MSTNFDFAGWHLTSMRVPLHEVDLGMAVYHGNYYNLFQVARDEFLRDVGFPYKQVMDLQLHLTIVEAHCEYRKSLRYDDCIQILTRPLWLKTRSLGMEQKILRAGESEVPVLCTQLSLNFVCVTFEGKVTRLPQQLVACLERHLPEK